jgi:hypothetical protein
VLIDVGHGRSISSSALEVEYHFSTHRFSDMGALSSQLVFLRYGMAGSGKQSKDQRTSLRQTDREEDPMASQPSVADAVGDLRTAEVDCPAALVGSASLFVLPAMMTLFGVVSYA